MPSYTEISVSGYDSSPPVDDGTVTESNRVQWSTIKTKLAGPLKTAVEALNTNIAAGITTITTNLATANTNLTTGNTAYTTATSVLTAPSTTAMLFKQTAAPTGWTKSATHNNKAIRLVSGAVSTGGSAAFTSVLAATTITSSNMPSHTHTFSGSSSIAFNDATWISSVSTDTRDNMDGGAGTACVDDIDVSSEAVSATGSASGTTGSAGSGTAMDFAVRYADIIIATKD
jgi:hypothetical protein